MKRIVQLIEILFLTGFALIRLFDALIEPELDKFSLIVHLFASFQHFHMMFDVIRLTICVLWQWIHSVYHSIWVFTFNKRFCPFIILFLQILYPVSK